MKIGIRLSEKFLVWGYIFILLFMIVQDLVPLGALNDIEGIASVESFNEIIVVTLIGVVQILLIMGGILFFIGKRYPIWIKIWLIIHPSCILLEQLCHGGSPFIWDWCRRKDRKVQCFVWEYPFFLTCNERNSAEYPSHYLSFGATNLYYLNQLYFFNQA